MPLPTLPIRFPALHLIHRLTLIVALVVVAVVSLSAGWVVQQARWSVREEVGASLHLAVQLLEAGFSGGELAPVELERRLAQLRHLERTRHLRIEVEGGGGPSLADTPVPRTGADGPPAWFGRLVGGESLRLERSLPLAGPRRVRLIAEPVDELRESWQETRLLLGVLAGTGLAVVLTVHLVLARALRPVRIILDGLAHVEHGDFQHRLPRFGWHEFDRIAAAFNHMAATLADTREANRALAREKLRVQEVERRFLARELHDELGQWLTAIQMLAATDVAEVDTARRNLASIGGHCEHLYGVVRNLMRRLWPAGLDDLGLAAALEGLCEHWRRCFPGGLEAAIDAGLDAAGEELRIQVYRIVQEALTNAARHARAESLRVRAGCEGSSAPSLRIEVEDDGIGFDGRQTPGGFGLAGIRERAESLGGEFRIESRQGGGTRLVIRLPWRGEAQR